MNCSSLIAIVALTFASLAMTGITRAEIIKVRFEGTVDGVSVLNRPELQGFDFLDVGDPFTGFYKFDSAALDTANSTEQGSFKTHLPDGALSISVGDFHFVGDTTVIVAFQNIYSVGDHIPHIGLISNSALSEILNIRNFSLTVNRPNLHSDPNILPFPPSSLEGSDGTLSIFMSNSLDLSPANWVSISANLDVLTVVPEPASLGVLVMSMFQLLFFRSRTD
jgi:hypothetical protein